MITYRTDELSFDLPEGFLDNSVHVFSKANEGISVTIARARSGEASIEDLATGALAQLSKVVPGLRVREQRDSEIGHLPAFEARVEGVVGKDPIYQRQAHVDWFGTHLLVSVTAAQRNVGQCNDIADAVLSSFRFRKP